LRGGSPVKANKRATMKVVYALAIGFVAANMITVVHRFEPNRMLARGLIVIIYLASALAILAKLGWRAFS
jgi:hypothetical protein